MKKAVSTAMALSMMVGLMGVNVNVNALRTRQEATMGFPSQC